MLPCKPHYVFNQLSLILFNLDQISSLHQVVHGAQRIRHLRRRQKSHVLLASKPSQHAAAVRGVLRVGVNLRHGKLSLYDVEAHVVYSAAS